MASAPLPPSFNSGLTTPSTMENAIPQDYAKTLSTCDLCRRRKSRCIKRNPTDAACSFCMSRGESCHFSFSKQRKSRQNRLASRGSSLEPVVSATRSSRPPASTSSVDCGLPTAQAGEASSDVARSTTLPTTEADGVIFQRSSNKYITSCGLAFFSENNLAELARRLGHDRVRLLLNELGTNSRADQATSIISVVKTQEFDATTVLQSLTGEMQAAYIQAFFTEIYPLYPFLDKQAFEATAFGPHVAERLRADKVWALLYCTILSLGILSREQGSFRPMEGSAWKLFVHVLRSFCDLLFARKTLQVAQTLTGMAIFAMVHSSWPVEELLITEAARVALALQMNKQAPNRMDSVERRRTFWVIYCIEKEYAFNSTQSSAFNDVDISCSLPEPVNIADCDVDWLLVEIDLCKILSSAFITLFSATARAQDAEYFEQEIRRIRNDLQTWKDSLHEHIRPDLPIRPRRLVKPSSLYATLQTHMLYYNLQIAMCRLLIHVNADRRCLAVAESKSILMKTARMIVEALSFIPVEPSTSMNIIGLTPIVATFILFDLVVYNPENPETPKNLIFLDIAAGYFQRLHIVSKSAQKGHLMADLTRIAREYVAKTSQGNIGGDPEALLRNESVGSLVDATVLANQRNFALETQHDHSLPPDLSLDPFTESDYMDLLQYPAVDSLDGLDQLYTGDLSLIPGILGESPSFNFSDLHDGWD